MNSMPSHRQQAKARFRVATGLGLTAVVCAVVSLSSVSQEPPTHTQPPGPYVVLAFNDLGMHCMNPNFDEICILPPFNNLHAQVIARAQEPHIVSSGVRVQYTIPGNTISSTKTNFWDYANALFGVDLPPDIGLAGNGLSGTMSPTGDNDWAAIGIPVTPITDKGKFNPYQLAHVKVFLNDGTKVASTLTVIPVSTEIHCDLCHNTQGITTETDILRAHDNLHGTNLEASKPVLCAACHADPALGTTGDPNVPTMSSAMHGAHASRMDLIDLDNKCYACHPGVQTECLRDVHYAAGMVCTDCHGDMYAVGDPGRTPWVDEPKCGDCHVRQGFQFEEPGRLFKNSRGHMNVHCAACHGSPHAITPTVTKADNKQAILHQGYPGVIQECTVCHTQRPSDSFPHRRSD